MLNHFPESLCLVMHLYSPLSSNLSSPIWLRCENKSWGRECRTHTFPQHNFCFTFVHPHLQFYWRMFLMVSQTDEEITDWGSISLWWSLCIQTWVSPMRVSGIITTITAGKSRIMFWSGTNREKYQKFPWHGIYMYQLSWLEDRWERLMILERA